MGLRSTLATLLSAPLATAVEARVRAVAEELFQEHQLANPADVRELARRLSRLDEQMTSLAADVATCRAALADDDDGDDDDDVALRLAGVEARDALLDEQVSGLRTAIHGLGDRIAQLGSRLGHAETAVAQVGTAAAAAHAAANEAAEAVAQVDTAEAAPAKADKGCRVDGCDRNHRARGFCARHYQMWQRNTLTGWVTRDDTVGFDDEGPRWRVPDGLRGQPAAQDGDRILVDGRRVESTLLTE